MPRHLIDIRAYVFYNTLKWQITAPNLVINIAGLHRLRARAKITSHFGISSLDHFWQVLKKAKILKYSTITATFVF